MYQVGEDADLARIREMVKEYKSMPSFIDDHGTRNIVKTGLYYRIEMKMKAFDMKYR